MATAEADGSIDLDSSTAAVNQQLALYGLKWNPFAQEVPPEALWIPPREKIRNAITQKTPNIFIVGGKEQENPLVTWRRYATERQVTLKFTDAKASLLDAGRTELAKTKPVAIRAGHA